MSNNRIIHNDRNHIITHLVILFISTELRRHRRRCFAFVSHPLSTGVCYCFAMVKCMCTIAAVPFVHLVKMIFPAFAVMFLPLSHYYRLCWHSVRTRIHTYIDRIYGNERAIINEWIEMHIDSGVYINRRWSLRLYYYTFAETILTSFNSI